MDVVRESVEWAFDGPLAGLEGLPAGFLYAVVVWFLHAGGRDAVDQVRRALRPALGEPQAERRLLGGGRRLVYTGTLALEADIQRKGVRLRLGQRVRAARLEDLVGALSTIPGARDLRVHAQRRTFAEPGSRSGPMLE